MHPDHADRLEAYERLTGARYSEDTQTFCNLQQSPDFIEALCGTVLPSLVRSDTYFWIQGRKYLHPDDALASLCFPIGLSDAPCWPSLRLLCGNGFSDLGRATKYKLVGNAMSLCQVDSVILWLLSSYRKSRLVELEELCAADVDSEDALGDSRTRL